MYFIIYKTIVNSEKENKQKKKKDQFEISSSLPKYL